MRVASILTAALLGAAVISAGMPARAEVELMSTEEMAAVKAEGVPFIIAAIGAGLAAYKLIPWAVETYYAIKYPCNPAYDAGCRSQYIDIMKGAPGTSLNGPIVMPRR